MTPSSPRMRSSRSSRARQRRPTPSAAAAAQRQVTRRRRGRPSAQQHARARAGRRRASCSIAGPRERAVERRPVGVLAHGARRAGTASGSAQPAAAAATPIRARAATQGSGGARRRRRRPSRRRGARALRARGAPPACACPRGGRSSRSRTLLTTRIARGEQADRHGEHEGLPRQLLDLHVVGAGHRDEAEEQEDEDLAEALVAVGPRAAGVEHAGEDRRARRSAAAPGRRRRSR